MVVVQGGSGTPTATVTPASDGPVTSDAALAQLAAEAGLLEGEPQEGEGVTFQMSSGMMEGEVGPQVDGAEDMGDVDMGQFWGGEMYQTQVDGDPGDEPEEEQEQQQREEQENMPPAEGTETAEQDAGEPQAEEPAMSGAGQPE